MDKEQATTQDEQDSLPHHASPSADLPSTYAQEVKLVDAEISHYLDLIQELRSRRNILVPVSRLPTEILCRIFLYVRASHEKPKSTLWRRVLIEPSLKWVAVSQVSRHWRNAAINEPRLWTNPPLDNVMWTTTMLQRSQMASLPTITLDLYKDHPESVIQITQQLHRMTSFTICTSDLPALPDLFASLPHAAPRLEVLSINCVLKKSYSRGNDAWFIDVSDSAVDEFVELSAALFTECRRLRRLQLRGIIPDWKSHLFGDSLEDLTLSQIPIGSRPSLAQFKALLKSAASLKCLTLVNASPTSTSNSVRHTTQPALLQSLEKLNLHSTILDVQFFLGAFDIPAVTEAVITLEYEEMHTVSDLDGFCSLLKETRLSRIIGSDMDIRRLELNVVDDVLSLQLLILDEANRRLHPDLRSYPTSLTLCVDTQNVDMDWLEEHYSEASSNFITSICKSFYSTGLSELDINLTNLYTLTPDELVSIFGAIPRLRAITVIDHRPVEALNQNASEYLLRTPESGPIMFSQLRHIFFASVVFGERAYFQVSLRSVQDCLAARQRVGFPIRSIAMQDCDGLSQQDIDTLRDKVEHLVWDGELDAKSNAGEIYSRGDLFD